MVSLLNIPSPPSAPLLASLVFYVGLVLFSRHPHLNPFFSPFICDELVFKIRF